MPPYNNEAYSLNDNTSSFPLIGMVKSFYVWTYIYAMCANDYYVEFNHF